MAGHIWPAGRSLDNTGLRAYCHIPYTVLRLITYKKLSKKIKKHLLLSNAKNLLEEQEYS